MKVLCTVLFLSCLLACTSPKQVAFTDGTVVNVKTVASICGETILNIEDTEFKGLGENFEWEGKNYDAAFKSFLPCLKSNALADFPGAESGQTFKVMLYRQRQPGGECMACMATFSKAPGITYFVLPAE